jgi:hypothetical protein
VTAEAGISPYLIASSTLPLLTMEQMNDTQIILQPVQSNTNKRISISVKQFRREGEAESHEEAFNVKKIIVNIALNVLRQHEE